MSATTSNNNNNQNLDTCGCCEGVETLTPVSVENRPGLSALAYRVGSHGSFKQSMHAGLSGKPALANLTTRDDDDPAVALLDAWAMVLDVLGFYQERIANEGYLRTALERRSVLELARHINYRLKPGVAAGTYLAFTMQDAEGSPTQAAVPVGTRVQSIPGQDEMPQTFETVKEITAKIAWNALQPLQTISQEIGKGLTRLYLKGTATQLQTGDAILLTGDERESDPGSENWDFRILHTVTTNDKEDYTLVTWEEALGHNSPGTNPADNPKVYVFRLRAALFGYNAPDWRSLHQDVKDAYANEVNTKKTQWPDFKNKKAAKKIIELDRIYPKILEQSFLALRKPGYIELYKALQVDSASKADFGLTGKSTRIKLDTNEHLDFFGLRHTEVFAQSEPLEPVRRPLQTAVFGTSILLDQTVEGLEEDHVLVVAGKVLKQVTVAPRSRVIKVGAGEMEQKDAALLLVSDDGLIKKALAEEDLLEVVKPPEELINGKVRWRLKDASGFTGTVTLASAEAEDFIPVAAKKDDPFVSEVVTLEKTQSDTAKADDPLTVLHFESALANVYLRDTVFVNGNVAQSTHGETKTEILGSGDGSKTFQEFQLKQKPLTYVSAATPSGTQTTLEVRVNDVLWKEVPAFYGVSAGERGYITRIADDGKVFVQFGDGITGTRLPTGVENIKATYRVGIGLQGHVKAEQLSLLMNHPLGVKSAVNPLAAAGAADPEARDQARQNAPLTVLTLDRIVSLRDFEDFTRAYAGIGKAKATWLWNGERQMIHITVAAVEGAAVETGSDLYKNLIAAIDGARHTHHQVQVDSYRPISFDVAARVKVASDYIATDVLAAVSTTLKEAFAFDVREFGQPVSPSEVTAVIQAVAGVIAVDLEKLNGIDPVGIPHFRLNAGIAHWDKAGNAIKAAQLLTINTDGIELTEMIK